MQTGAVVLFYCMCSGGMLVLNKLCLNHAPLASTLSLVQFTATLSWCAMLHVTNRARLEVTAERVRAYLTYVVLFSGAVYTNMRSLSLLSVETIIVVRSCCPLLVAAMECLMLGRAPPSSRSHH